MLRNAPPTHKRQNNVRACNTQLRTLKFIPEVDIIVQPKSASGEAPVSPYATITRVFLRKQWLSIMATTAAQQGRLCGLAKVKRRRRLRSAPRRGRWRRKVRLQMPPRPPVLVQSTNIGSPLVGMPALNWRGKPNWQRYARTRQSPREWPSRVI